MSSVAMLCFEGLPIILPHFIPCIQFPAFYGILWTMITVPKPQFILIAYTIFGVKMFVQEISNLSRITKYEFVNQHNRLHKLMRNKFILSSIWTLIFLGLTLVKRFRKLR